MRPTTSALAESAARPPRHAYRRLAVTGFVLLGMCTTAARLPGQPAAGNAAAPAEQPAAGNAQPLPEGFTPPAAAPPEFSFEKELMSSAELAELEKGIRRTRFSRVDLSPTMQAQIKDWATHRVYQLALKDNRRRLAELRYGLMRELREAGKLTKNDSQAVRRFREMIIKEVHDRAVQLLAPDTNFFVRFQAVLILSELTLMEEDQGNNVREEAYTPAADALHKIVADPQQHQAFQALKIAACRGLTRIFLIGTLRSDLQKTQIARDLIAQLNDPALHPGNPGENADGNLWYQSRLCETLGSINLEISADNKREPLILDALSRVAADKTRSLRVRADAAKALGRAPLAAGTNDQVLAWVIADVAHDVTHEYVKDAQAAQQQRLRGPLASRLEQSKLCFWRIYLAFQFDKEEDKLYIAAGRKPGLLAKRTGDKFIADAYGVTVPAAAHVLRQPAGRAPQVVWHPLPPAQVKSLADWLANNVPANARLHQSLQPLALNAPGARAAAGNGNGLPNETLPTSTVGP